MRPAHAAGAEHRRTDRAALGDEDGRHLGVLHQLDEGMRPHHLRQAADQCRAGPVAAGVDDPRAGMGGLEPKAEPPVRPTVEPGAEREKLVNPSWTFTCKYTNGFGIGQAVAGCQGVRGVLAGAVTRAEGDGDAPLRPGAGAVGEGFLGEDHRPLPLRSEPPCRPQACDARADDDGARRVHGEIYGGSRRTRGEA